ncbi:hypothetical protein ACQBAT_12650 [Ornithinimicrobium sp. Y1847]|uniref:hypothetical protein n=1 Tax=unclassified Ornithinimicrobium TaxID=2615080 RepID=UPI003B67823F
MTWERHRHIGLAWALLAGLLLVVGNGVWRYTGGGVALSDDLPGAFLRVVVVGVIVLAYLRSGGRTTATCEGLVVHDGVREHTIAADQVAQILEDRRRGGGLAVLKSGRRLELPGVPAKDLRTLQRQLKR